MTHTTWNWIWANALSSIFIIVLSIILMMNSTTVDQAMIATTVTVAFTGFVCAGLRILSNGLDDLTADVPLLFLTGAAIVCLKPAGIVMHFVTLIGALGLSTTAAYFVVSHQRPRRLGLGTAAAFGLQTLALWGGSWVVQSDYPLRVSIVVSTAFIVIAALVPYGTVLSRRRWRHDHDVPLDFSS
ncbi:MAG: hypothetical protein P4M11_00520 [Candidatus Pacebacteria bacterium]|nr:hypothetical protein [Candidatus Paceibacterota bacterium]